MYERGNLVKKQEMPIKSSGCKRFFKKCYKATHQVVCPAAGTIIMVLVVSLTETVPFENYSDGFKQLLSDSEQNDTGNCVITNATFLMVGFRSYTNLKSRKGKVIEN